MPDPISVPNPASGAVYHLDENVCPVKPPTSPMTTPQASTPDSSAPAGPFSAGAQRLIERHSAPPQLPAPAQGHDTCATETLKAVAICGQALRTAASAPTFVGVIVAGVLGGVLCGLASREATSCLEKQR